MKKISAVYKITNTVTGDFYIGSSIDVKRRWKEHKHPSRWNRYPSNPMYLDFQKYGIDKFEFQILEEAEIASLKEAEQRFIETLHPVYNNYNAKGLNVKRQKKYKKEYHKSYDKTEKARKSHKKADKKYNNKLCLYNSEILTLCALASRFQRAGIEHYTKEAGKYIIKN